MLNGETAKFAALALVPIVIPPVATVYQLMVLPDDVAFRFEEEPTHIAAAVAVTEVGADGIGFTVTVTAVRALTHPAPLNASA